MANTGKILKKMFEFCGDICLKQLLLVFSCQVFDANLSLKLSFIAILKF